MSTTLENVKYLSEIIGPRGSTTLKEKEAADYIKEKMKWLGIEVSVEPFKFYPSFSYPYGVLYFLSAMGGLLILTENYFLSFLLSFAALIIFFFETHTYELISRLIPHYRSQNVLCKIKPFRQKKRLLVVLTHYDTSRSALTFSPNMVKSFRFSFLIMVFCLVLIPVFAVLGLIFKENIWSYFALLPSLYLLFVTGLMIHREVFCKYSPGANDNASGVGVLLSLAETLKKQPLENVEVWFLFTGCEEAGMGGMQSFLQKHKNEIKQTYFLNVDNVGIGDIKYITAEGMLKSYPANQELISIAKEVAFSHPELGAEPKVYNTLTTDALPVLVRGYKVMSIMCFDKEGIIPHWHWKTDVFANIEVETLNKVDKYLLGIVREIDNKLGKG